VYPWIIYYQLLVHFLSPFTTILGGSGFIRTLTDYSRNCWYCSHTTDFFRNWSLSHISDFSVVNLGRASASEIYNRLCHGRTSASEIDSTSGIRNRIEFGNWHVLGRVSASGIDSSSGGPRPQKSGINSTSDISCTSEIGNRLCHPLILIISKSGDFDRRCSWRWGTQSTTLDAGRRGGTSNVAKLKRRWLGNSPL